MDQEKIANLIKEIRKKNNLTQKELADKLGVTYQAVSKWENAKNIPDLSVLKEIKRLYNIDIDSILDGEISKKNNKKYYIIILISIIVIITALIIIFLPKNINDFEFRQISTTCDDFNISGSVVYNKNKKVIYISNIEYCGEVNNEVYSKIECSLYESYNDTEKKINTCDSKESVTLEEYLKNLTIKEEHDSSTCNMFSKSDVYLLINATSKNNKVTTYKIPIKLDNCD